MKAYHILLWFVIVCSSLLRWTSGFAAPNENEVVVNQGFTVLNASITSALRDASSNSDMNYEISRRETLKRMPSSSSLNRDAAAQHGLYFTENDDILQCFSCKRCSFKWEGCSINYMNSKKLHEPDCQLLADSQRAGNIAIDSHVRLNFIDYSNNGEPSQEGQPAQPILSRFHSTEEAIRNPSAINQGMSGYASRLGSYDNWNHRGNNQRGFRPALNFATPATMAEAGFFYLGGSDRVKCWYCNGGLQNWDANDDPWTEHARWYPECHYLVEKKGPTFILNVVQEYRLRTNVFRLRLSNPTNNQTETMREVRAAISQSYGPSFRSGPNYLIPQHTPAQQPELIADPIDSLKHTLAKVDQDQAINTLTEMGYNSDLVKACAYSFYLARDPTDNTQAGIGELLDILLNESESEHSNLTTAFRNAKERVLLAQMRQDRDAGYLDDTSLSAKERIRRAVEARKCKVCKREEDDYRACIVLIPCGHLAVCRDCDNKGKPDTCPICRRVVEQRIRSYMAYQKQRKGFIRPHRFVALTR